MNSPFPLPSLHNIIPSEALCLIHQTTLSPTIENSSPLQCLPHQSQSIWVGCKLDIRAEAIFLIFSVFSTRPETYICFVALLCPGKHHSLWHNAVHPIHQEMRTRCDNQQALLIWTRVFTPMLRRQHHCFLVYGRKEVTRIETGHSLQGNCPITAWWQDPRSLYIISCHCLARRFLHHIQNVHNYSFPEEGLLLWTDASASPFRVHSMQKLGLLSWLLGCCNWLEGAWLAPRRGLRTTRLTRTVRSLLLAHLPRVSYSSH